MRYFNDAEWQPLSSVVAHARDGKVAAALQTKADDHLRRIDALLGPHGGAADWRPTLSQAATSERFDNFLVHRATGEIVALDVILLR